MKRENVVIDTNVLIASLIGQSGFPRRIFDELVLSGEVKICLSQAVLEEYEEVTEREKFKKYPNFVAKAQELIAALRKIAVFVEPTETIQVLPDEDDDKFLELAVAADASFVVTGNTKDFLISEFRGINICTPKEFYEVWTQ
ncbi:MAG: putative toxin-antitoxin system toxin component, PIN family [Saprospiraceae bacterium]|nr:putative toxin-antitoxin system toxin component, PIN family [Saprospiraceae bacterium]